MAIRTTRVEVAMPASNGGEWTVTITAKAITCDCPSFQYQRVPVDDRECKHARRITRHTVDDEKVA